MIFPDAEFRARTERLQAGMAAAEIDALLLTSPADIFYTTGFLTRFWESPTRPWFVVLPRIGRSEPEPEPSAAPQLIAAVPPAHVAAITGAIACMVEPRHIIHIEDRRRGAVWTAEGRLIHQTSHNVPHGKKS